MTDFSEPWDLGDVIFNVEGRKLYANRMVMSMWSPVMKAMLTGDIKEKNAEEIELPGKAYKDILQLLKVIHPSDTDITDANVGMILPLAHEYQMDELTGRCERYLLGRPPSCIGMLLADTFKLDKLKTYSMTYFDKHRLYEVSNKEEFSQISSDTKVKILHQKCMTYENILYEIKKKLSCQTSRNPSARCASYHAKPDRAYRSFLLNEIPEISKTHNLATNTDCQKCMWYSAVVSLEQLEKELPK